MINKYTDVSKRARNSIVVQTEKLVKKYGEKSVRLVIMKIFGKKSAQRKLEEEIAQRERELERLRRKSK